MHVPAGHVVCCHRGGVCTERLGPPSLLAAILNHCSPKIFFFFFNLPRVFGCPNMLKNSLKMYTHIGICSHLDAAETGTRACHRGSTAPPGAQSENLMYSSHILAHIHMKLGTTYRSHEPEQLSSCIHRLRQQEVGYLGLFKKCMLWNLIYSSEDTTRLPPNSVNMISRHWGRKIARIFLISRTVCRGEAMNLWRKWETGSV